MSREARLRGKDMILGPAINIQRIPTGGRTYEYLSEDPLLSGVLAVAYTKGSQDEGTAVCLKHYALNNQEDYRGFVDVHVSDRTMHELYLRPFEMAVREADAWGVMAAYNKVNGRWCSENEQLLNTILRQQWGFPGMVISDWGGVHSTVDAVTAGMNVEMPGDRYMGKALLDSVKAGKVSEEVINQRVREILRVRLTVKPIAKEKANSVPVGNPEEMKVALEVARRSIVLLKNEQLLPIDLQHIKTIAVIGENAVTKMALGGVGAGVKDTSGDNAVGGLADDARQPSEDNLRTGLSKFRPKGSQRTEESSTEGRLQTAGRGGESCQESRPRHLLCWRQSGGRDGRLRPQEHHAAFRTGRTG